GTHASQIISHHHLINGAETLIKGAKAHTSTPQCQRCWKWGHMTDACCCPATCCPICAGPHTEANHQSLAGEPCIHACPCLNCGNQHVANDWHCPYWHYHFNWTWLKEQ
ncbi:hypothetical protein P691DRAFT_640579, partial [Macrolepiota fuliginosa MF-IS2]